MSCLRNTYLRPKFQLAAALISIFICTENLYSQFNNLRFEHVSYSDGLSSNDIRCIIQDYIGFLWIGTQNGLNRYDGKNIKIFRTESDDSTTISSNWINTLYEDSNGNLWIGTRSGGLNLFERETGKFVNWQNNPEDPNTISGNDIGCILEDSKGKLWIGTNGSGLNLFDRKNNRFRKWETNPLASNSLSNNSISTIAEDNDGRLWMGTDGGGINIFDFTTNTFYQWDDVSIDKSNYPSHFINTIFKDKLNNIWIGSDKAITKFIPSSGKYKHWITSSAKKNGFGSGLITKIFYDDSGGLWIGTKSAGLKYFDPKTETFSHSKYSEDKFALSSNTILAICKDNSNVLWLGTHGGGLNKLPLKNLAFQYWQPDPSNKEGLPGKEIRRLFVDKDETLWIGTNSGLSKFDRNKNTFQNYFANPKDPNSLISNRIRAIYRSKKGILYVGPEKGGLCELDEKTGRFISYLPKSGNIDERSSRNLRTICEDLKGILWLGAYNGGLHRFDPKIKKLERISISLDGEQSYHKEKVEIIITHDENEIWLGTENGLILFNTETYNFKKWVSKKGDPNSIIHSAVRTLYEDEDGILWIGTRGGLSRFDLKKNSFTNFTTRDGLPSDLVFGLFPLSQDEIWLITLNNITQFNTDSFVFKNISIPFVQQLSIGINSPYNSKEVFLGDENGLTIFKTDNIQVNNHKAGVVFTEFRKFNQPLIMEADYPQVKTLNLDYSDNMFSIRFALLDFSNPLSNLYAYKLDGFSDDWIQLNNSNEVTFTNLDPGDYRLLVKAANDNELWNQDPAILHIAISPPFWKTWWFRISVLIILSIIIIGTFENRNKKIKRQRKILEEKVNIKTKLLRESNNKLVKAQEDIFKEKNELSITLKSISDGVLTTDRNALIKLSNRMAEHIIEKPKEELFGKKLLEVLTIDDPVKKKKIENAFSNLTPNESKIISEEKVTIKFEDGSTKILMLNASILKDDFEKIRGVVIILRDISEIIKMETQVALSQKMESIGHLSAGIAHEINTPLQYISDNNDFLKNAFNGFAEYKSSLETKIEQITGSNGNQDIESLKESLEIEFLSEEIPAAISQTSEGIKYVSKIVKAMKNFSYSSNGNKKPKDINQALETVVTITKNEWKYFSTVELDLSDEMPEINCIEDELKQVFLNLVVNAAHANEIKFNNDSGDKGLIKIKSSYLKDRIKIQISDNGIGIKEEDKNKIFDQFFTTKDVGKGTGQGLAIAYDVIVNNHKGNIEVISEFGTGTEFIIVLPVNAGN